jgi:hypothetical protein
LTLCLALVLEVSRQLMNCNSVNWSQIIDSTKLRPRLITICSGLVLYVYLSKTIQYIFHVEPSSRFHFISLHDILPRLIELKNVLIRMFILPEPILPISLKIILAIIGILTLFICGWNILSKSPNKSKIINLSIVLFLLLIAALSIIGVALAVKVWYPAPRVLSAISFFWAGIIALAYLNTGKKIRLIVVTLSSIVIFGFIGINNHILTDQLRVNMRDFHKASRIIARMENNSDFKKIQRIAIIGENCWNYPSPIDTAQEDMNISAFSKPWSKVSILNELSGYNFAEATSDEQKKAEEYCRGTPKWPEPESLIINGYICIVCI